MGDIPITIACGDYDRTRPISDGRVTVEGCAVTYLPMEPEEIFFRAVRYREFDVCEMSFSSFTLQRARGETHYIGLPVFISRVFRHSGIYIRTDRGIKRPEDLKGRLVGVPEYQMTAAVWIRGMLQDEYGVKAADIRWRNGGLEQPGRDERAAIPDPPGIELRSIPAGDTLSKMLEVGEIDAIVTARAPSCFDRGAPNVARLFPDYRTVEQAYFRKTGLFPIMHLVVVRQSLAERNPWLPASLFKAFLAAKEIALEEVARTVALNVTLPWVGAEADATKAVMGADYWPYGIAENAKAIAALTRYSHEQGLSPRALKAEDLFAPSTFAVSRI